MRSGFVTLVGRPNTGKSTLINALVGRKVAIVSPHPQTTRTHLLGVLNLAASENREACQAVLVDTPGVHRGRGQLSREMARAVRHGLEGRDLTLFLADATRRWGAEDEAALHLLQGTERPAFLVLNKVDLIKDKGTLLPVLDGYRQRFPFAELFPVSALRHQGLESLISAMVQALPEGPEYFPEGQITDQPERFQIAEMIREQAMLATHEEVPHTLAVRVEADVMQANRTPPLRRIQATLYCERPGQKAILIGRGGEMIRRVGTQARKQLETWLGCQVFLELQVVVRAGWRENPDFVAALDYHRE